MNKKITPARLLHSEPDVLVSLRKERGLRGQARPAEIRRAIGATLHGRLEQIPVSVAVFFASEKTISSLNAMYRGIRGATDVLSFSGGALDPETGRLMLGEVTICLPVAERQAKRSSRALEEEILHLVIHGTLHLIGHDHNTALRKQKMWKAQKDIQKLLREKPLKPHGKRK